MRLTHCLCATVLAIVLSAPSFSSAATKKYQVTGPIVELSDKTITVEKDKERWEIERSADIKIEGELKVGAKVTIYYHMVADKVEVKGDAKGDAK